MSDELRPGYVLVAVCAECGELPTNCGCLEGCHLPGGIQRHPRRVHCCLCEAVTHEFVRWRVGDSYSFGPLCLQCRQSKDACGEWHATGIDSPSVSRLIRDELV